MSNLSAIRWMNKCKKELTKGDDINIKSHSFRINYVTSILKKHPVNIAQSIIGHRSIDTTMRYDRNTLSSDKVKQILNNI